MAPVRRHASRLLRIATVVALSCLALSAARLHAQSTAGQSLATAVPGGTPGFTPLPAASEPAVSKDPTVLDIRITGNNRITREKVLSNIGTRIDRPFDEVTYQNDIRKLNSKNWFVHVHGERKQVPGGIILTLEVVERPTLEYVKFLGNKRMKTRVLAKEAGLKKGDSLDPYAVTEGRQKMETLYQTKGFNDVKVTILEGDKPGDHGAVYLISEGVVQKIRKVRFEGNNPEIAAGGKLKTLIGSKPPLLMLFKGQVDRKKIEEDVEKLTNYYRGLGFFKAHVGRDYELNDKENWMTLIFYINEGPRYKVRNVSFVGNNVYTEDALSSNLKLKGGDWFNQAHMNTDIANFKDIYGSNGYVFADANPQLKFFEEPGELDLVYEVAEGKQYRIGDITIQIKGDNPHTRYSTVLNRLSMRPGDLADIRQFRNSERRLKASGLYKVDQQTGDAPKIAFSPPDSEDGSSSGGKKKRAVAKGDPNSFRGQSPDEAPATSSPPASSPPGEPKQAPPRANAQTSQPAGYPGRSVYERPQSADPGAAPAVRPAPQTAPTVRGQSPDGGYGGYGGRAVNPISPGPQPYTANQGQPPAYNPPVYGSQPGAGGGYQPPPTQGYGPPSSVNQGGGQSGASPNNGADPSNPPNFPDPNSFLVQPEQPTVPVTVDVSEAQTGKFMFGAGVNSNAGLLGSIVIDEQNFDINRWPTSWEDFRSGKAFRGAGQKFRVEAAPGTVVSRYTINFSEPYLFDMPVSFGVSGYYFNRFYRDWTEQRAGGQVNVGYQFTPDLSGMIGLRAEDIRIYQPRVLGVPDLDAVLGHTQLYTVKTNLAHDTRDNTFLPTEGHFISAGFEYAFGSFQFPRFTTSFQKFFLLRERPDGSGRHTLSLFNQFGLAGNNTPIYERFFAGGYGTLRGFQFRGASPQIDTVEVGGDFENVSTIEYMFPITADDMLKGVTFVDFGTVEISPSHLNIRNMRVAPGFGLRVTVPMISQAPIALDFAFPVQYAPNDIRQVFSFFVGLGH